MGHHHLTVTHVSRRARARLGPTAWAVLEDVALDARRGSGTRLVAVTNVRRIAIHLGISKDSAARGLVRLADAGLVLRLHRRREPSGSFAPSAYELRLSPDVGLALATAERATRRAVLDERAAPVDDSSGARDSRRGDDVVARPRHRRNRASSSDQRTLFDMGSEASEHR